MTRRRTACITLLAVIASVFGMAAKSPADASTSSRCYINSTAGGFSGAQGIMIHGRCVALTEPTLTNAPAYPTKVVDCPILGASATARTGLGVCGATPACVITDPATKRPTVVPAMAELQLINGRWQLQGQPWCPARQRPMPTAAAIREHAIRLLPSVQIGSAWTTQGLINAETVLWADTTADRTLPSAQIVGTTVAVRIHFDHATWDFGDGTTDRPTTPGKAYTETDPCATAQCPHYYGHTYRSTGPKTITMTITWTAQYAIGDGGWTDLGAITGPQTTHAITIDQARGVLVDHPH